MKLAIGENASIEFPLNSNLRQIGTHEDKNVPPSHQSEQGGYRIGQQTEHPSSN
jgi:hypothetical protein